jgi:hypothetical protein
MAPAPQWIVLPSPKPIKTLPVEFKVDGAGNVCLATNQYENLALNMSDILRWVREAQWQLSWYHKQALKQAETPAQ